MDFEELYENIEDLDVIINFQEIIKVIEQPIPDAVWETYDVGDVLLSVQEKLKAKKHYDLIADFFTVIQKNNTEIMDDIGFYLIRDLVRYYAFKGDFDSVASTFEWMINDPLLDFDIYVLAFKSLALYQQNELIMKAIKKNYFEVEQSDKLIGYALSEFDRNLYYLETQNVYLSYGKPFNVNKLKKLLKPYGFILDEDPTYTYDTGFFDEFPDLDELKKLFAKSMDECMMLLRNFFMKRMLEKGMQFNVSGLLFSLIRNYWQEFTINKKNPKWKG
ncbi:MAG: hypothetical protein KJ754_10680, partial [Bacteroidetes bacterium]|nr:hypothetical protein [Bacteroidota bacterium]